MSNQIPNNNRGWIILPNGVFVNMDLVTRIDPSGGTMTFYFTDATTYAYSMSTVHPYSTMGAVLPAIMPKVYSILGNTIDSVAPPTGTTAGGDTVTIKGRNFQASATVNFDGTPATSVTVIDPGTLTCVTPAHGAGAVDVTLTQSGNTVGLNQAFTYA